MIYLYFIFFLWVILFKEIKSLLNSYLLINTIHFIPFDPIHGRGGWDVAYTLDTPQVHRRDTQGLPTIHTPSHTFLLGKNLHLGWLVLFSLRWSCQTLLHNAHLKIKKGISKPTLIINILLDFCYTWSFYDYEMHTRMPLRRSPLRAMNWLLML